MHDASLLPDAGAHFAAYLAVVLVAAKLGGELALRLRQPPVLGELLAGILLGSLPFAGLEPIRSHPGLDLLSQLGAIVLLFAVGLESTVAEVLSVGFAAVRVALLGVGGTIGAAWLVAWWLLPGAGALTHGFFALSLTATSIGVTARVLRDMRLGRTPEARTILGAAVVDDVLALVLLAVIAGWTGSQRGTGTWTLVWVVVKTLLFLVAALAIGVRVSPLLLRLTARLRIGGAHLVIGLAFCMALAAAAEAMGLAAILGAFTAGLVIQTEHAAPFVARGEPPLSSLIQPLADFVVPVFFVVMGTHANLTVLARPSALALTLGAIVAAVAGKLACGLGVGHGVNRVAVSMGMVPRGEVSLIFASLGASTVVDGQPILSQTAYCALVAVVVATTLAAPLGLNLSFGRLRQRNARDSPSAP